MNSTTNNYCNKRFIRHILSLSHSSDYKTAVKEWDTKHITIDDEPTYCPCGHPIIERCYIHNRITSEETFVGNICIKKFMEIDNTKIVAGLKRIVKEPYKSPNKALIKYADDSGFLFVGEDTYLYKNKNRQFKNLPTMDKIHRLSANRRIANSTVVRGIRI